MCLDIGRREIRPGAEQVALEPLVFDLLVYLMANRDRVFSKSDVLYSIWSAGPVGASVRPCGCSCWKPPPVARLRAIRDATGSVSLPHLGNGSQSEANNFNEVGSRGV